MPYFFYKNGFAGQNNKKGEKVDTDKNWSRLIQWNFFNWKNRAAPHKTIFHFFTNPTQRRCAGSCMWTPCRLVMCVGSGTDTWGTLETSFYLLPTQRCSETTSNPSQSKIRCCTNGSRPSSIKNRYNVDGYAYIYAFPFFSPRQCLRDG